MRILTKRVGWVERSETHHLRGFVMGFASSIHLAS
jgi:hypothetical protein